MTSPGHKNISYNAIDSYNKPATMYKENVKDQRGSKLGQDKAPGPGDFEQFASWTKINARRKDFLFDKQKRNEKHFTDVIKNSKMFIPGPGKIDVTNKHYNMISRSPTSIKSKRH